MTDETVEAPRDLRRELTNALRRCTPKQRMYLRRVQAGAGQKWSDAVRGTFSRHTLQKWLRMERVQQVLALHAELAELDSGITRERQLREYERIAFARIDDFRGPGGTRKPFKDWTEEQCAAVSEIEFDDAGNVSKVKLHRKGAAQDALARITGLLVEKHKHEVTLIQEFDKLTDEQLEDIARRGSPTSVEPPKGKK